MNKGFDIVIDTNVLVSAIRSSQGASFKLLSLIGKNHYQHHISVPLVFEYEEILHRQGKLLGLDAEIIDDILNYNIATAISHELYFLWRPCLNDPKDEMVLELAITANCEYIITYNLKHFNRVKGFKVRAITPKEFLTLIGG
ncbi:MAG: putative toxin-antitoxin system toxin component, PIN family [Candidatus Raymondbacteria bacterium RifOxyA12_full_50_37]|uniref:Putative toxin-antitoxin system toxin component, PIN family n=1 Tax=Candidatus Raymondbacteria bacterium RIFOXYD12_FULL_49_13 TaxID=1817890 RepID=A0A1F7F3Y4_UNCRA|nr:MAG: putative toxin-antitoxin system toxin component, PIN family [Candidatus Raymondbacteria bacterium RifOxyA12_full_50_37]OGJ90782.1 MAG: putative toxin-antitoxin system toxin component, PIN family [Candidatus Raymondbacteria bacterium RIFOXYA2_FULL_49_16]OGJ91661.1 MAG: putative toxin-antitoxin system toxin component, PIN family [Candidatus Raymondbacteria bacterium RifOxyB12_full_50_8]OGJ97276.1 MAG: putative toxin-antitoxin system toxin component, PIN family [Candidatus Raymondbacteria b